MFILWIELILLTYYTVRIPYVFVNYNNYSYIEVHATSILYLHV